MPPAVADEKRPGPGAAVRAGSGHFQLFRVDVATRRDAARRLIARAGQRAGGAGLKLAEVAGAKRTGAAGAKRTGAARAKRTGAAGAKRTGAAGLKRGGAAGSTRARAARLRRSGVARMRRAGMASPKRAMAAARTVARASAVEGWTVTRGAAAKAWSDRVPGLAAEAGFWALLSLTPLLLVLVAAIGYLAPLFGSQITLLVQEKLQHAAAHILAPTAVEHVLNPVLTDVVLHGRGGIISVSSLLALWTGSTAINTYVNTITIAYGMREVRSAVRARLLAFVIYLGALVVGIVALPLLVTAPGWIIDVSPAGVSGIVTPAVEYGYWPTVVALCTVLLVVLYHVAVPVRGPLRRDLPGAIIAMLLWLGSSYLLRTYLAYAIGHSPTYGALSAPIAALLFLYVTSLAILLGAEINAEIDRDRIRRDTKAALRAEGSDGQTEPRLDDPPSS
jgi:membrane protein